MHLTDRLYSRTRWDQGCLIFTGSSYAGHKYGKLKVRRKTVSAHRLSWTLNFGPVPDDLSVLHLCDNGLCINPCHLFLGTIKDNVYDMYSKGRQGNFKGSSNGRAKISEEDVLNIKKLYSTKLKQQEIADMYKINISQVSRIISNKRWKHL